MRDKLYMWGLSAAGIATLVLILYDALPWNWANAELGGTALSLAVVVGLVAFLAGADHLAKRQGMGEARFDKDGKVIEDE